MLTNILHYFKLGRRLSKPDENMKLVPYQRTVGRGTYGDPQVFSWVEGTSLSIGSFCSIAAGVKILLGGEHRVDWVTTYPFSGGWETAKNISGHPKTKGDVVIGNDVWIGMDAVIMSGVKIGDGAVIGARAVVTRDVESYAIVAGNPARLIRRRFDDETIQRLLKIRWWDWGVEQIKQMLPLMLSSDIRKFIDEAEKIDERSSDS